MYDYLKLVTQMNMTLPYKRSNTRPIDENTKLRFYRRTLHQHLSTCILIIFHFSEIRLIRLSFVQMKRKILNGLKYKNNLLSCS